MSVFIGYPSFMAYQMMKGKKGNNDDFPSIPGMIARWSAKGLTNEDMSTNPVWKDLTGNGHDLQMKNFGWAGMSGVNGYVENFNDFRTGGIPVEQLIVDEQNSSLIKISVLVPGINNSIYIPKDRYQFGKSYYLRVSSEGYNEGDLSFLLYATAVSTATSIRIPLNPNGITEIPAVQEDDYQAAYITVGGKMGSLTIEQLPLYPGFILGDGVDDEAVTKNNLDLEDTYTVYTPLILLKYGGVVCGKSAAKDYSLNTVISSKSIGFDSANAWSGSIPVDLYKFVLVVCKRNSKTLYVKDLITGKSNQSNSKEFVSNPGKYFIWRNTGGSWSQVAIAGQVICNGYFSTDEDDEKVLNYYKQEYPWLFPDQAWTVVGKTNEDTDRATIANITGNGNDLVLSNFGFAENSGYGLYGENYLKWHISPSRVEATGTNKSFNITSIKELNISLYYQSASVEAAKTIPSYTIKVTGLTDGQELKYMNLQTPIYNITSDGLYKLPSFGFVGAGSFYGFNFSKLQESCDITIEQIPEYEGYLVTDGVDDKIISSNFKFGENYTVVGEWKFLQEASNVSAGFVKNSNYWILYNYKDGINAYIKADAQGSLISGVRSIKASTSKGDIYPDFNSYVKIEPGKRIESQYALNIAVNSSIFTKLAFKNLAIYSEVLSKDDCIKAYNYLQTLKAK